MRVRNILPIPKAGEHNSFYKTLLQQQRKYEG